MKTKEGGVMDIQKEREAFESHLKKMGKTDNETFSKNEDDSYQMDIIHFGWKIWQTAKAQSVPEGFVVLAIDDMERICRCLDDHAVYITYKASDALESIQKAMIEAQEPAND